MKGRAVTDSNGYRSPLNGTGAMSRHELKKHDGRRVSPALLWALAHPVRRQVLRQLHAQAGSCSPAELADTIATSLTALSYHMRTLHDLGITRLTHTEPVGGAEKHYYVSNIAGLEHVEAILADTEVDDLPLWGSDAP
jgi:DNA-binding transcriptional ArsR family regulator